ncbi:hypothetical protein CPC08DRAFT_755216 [Agrocybe pediades]|nr:hypothetical protein CPC08DRAFT_755216 [Agrocybe pediades]
MSALRVLRITLLHGIQTARYAHVSAASIVFYDYVITLEQEIRLIWKGPRSFGQLLFLINRYLILAAAMVDMYCLFSPSITAEDDFLSTDRRINSCSHFPSWQAWTGIVITMLSEAILQLRIYALYGHNQWVVTGMLILFATSLTVSCFIIVRILSGTTGIVLPKILGGPFCLPNNLPRFYTFFVPTLAFELVLCLLASGRLIKVKRSLVSRLIDPNGKACRMVHTLLEESALYFIAYFGIVFIRRYWKLMFITAPPEYISLAFSYGYLLR